MAERKFAIRFSVEDMEKVRAALKGMGADGASALTAIDRASRGASPQLKAVDVAAKEVRETFNQWADRIPVVGSALQALGPIGTAVAAGFAGITLGLGALSNASRRAVQDIGNLKDAADAAGFGVEDFQAVRGAGLLAGVDRREMDSMLATLAANSARASEGFGRMKTALDKVNPELSRQMELTQSQSERMNILARAVQNASTYNEKLNIAVAAFGNNGGKMVAMLDEQGAAMDTWTERALRAGIVLDENLVAAVDALGDRMEAARARTEVAMTELAVTVAPLEEWMEKFKGNAAQGWAWTLQGQMFKSIEDQSTSYLMQQFLQMGKWYNDMKAKGISDDSPILSGTAERGSVLEQLQRMRAELLKRQAEDPDVLKDAATQQAEAQIKADAEDFAAWLDNWYIGMRRRQRDEAADAAAEAARKAEEAARLRASQEREAIEVRSQLGDWTGKLAAEEERLNTLVTAGVLSRDQANASLAQTRAELDGSAATAERWKSALQSAEGPIERAERALAEFDAEVAKYGDLVGVNEDAVWTRLVGELEEAKRAANEATPAMRAVAEARALIKRHEESLMTDEQKISAKAQEWDALAAAFENTGFTAEEAAKAVAAYRAELEKTKDAQRDNTFELRFAAEVMGEIFDENMNSLEDLGKTAMRVFRSMAMEWIMANQKMATTQGGSGQMNLWDFIANAFTSSFGGGQPTPAPQTGYQPSHGQIPGQDSGGMKGVFHAGGVIGSTPVSTRWTSSAIFAGAPRMHSGGELRSGERAIIAEDGERMLSRVDNARIVRAIEAGRGGATNVEVHFHGVSEQPEVRQSRTPDGGLRVDVMMRNAALQALGSREGAQVMEQQYGIKRSVRL